MREWKILARHDWIAGAVITESVNENKSNIHKTYRRFTATVRGWRDFKVWEGYLHEIDIKIIINKVREIRDRIDKGDESVFKVLRVRKMT